MAEWVQFPGFCDQAYTMRSQNIAVDRIVNMYPVTNEVRTGKGGRSLVARPGCVTFAALGGTGRGLWGGEGRMFAISGTTLYEITSGGTATSLGDVGAGTSPCQMIFNGTQVMVCNPSTGILRVHDGVSMSSPTTPAGASQGAYLDGYGFIVAPDSNNIFQSDLLDFKTWNPLAQAQRLTQQDRIVTLRVANNLLWIIGSKTTEAWYNAGTSPFALQRVGTSFVEEGTASAFAPAVVDDMLVMLTSSERGLGRVVAITPGRATRISTYAVEYAISGYSNLDQAVGFATQSQGHTCYCLSFPSANVQWVYDFTEGAWHERIGGTIASPTLPPGLFGASTFGGVYLMDTAGTVTRPVEPLYTDYAATTIAAQRVSPLLFTGKRVALHGFRLDQQILTASVDVGAAIEVSRNGGLTYGASRTAVPSEHGSPLDYTNTLEWRNLGQCDQRGFAIRATWGDIRNIAVGGAWIKASEAIS